MGGFAAKTITLDTLTGWQQIVMNVAAVGTAIAFAKLLFLPVQTKAISAQDSSPKKGKVAALWWALVPLVGGLLFANSVYAYTLKSVLKALLTLGVGWLIYGLMDRFGNWDKLRKFQLPRAVEQLEHLIGVMSLMSVLLFWMALA